MEPRADSRSSFPGTSREPVLRAAQLPDRGDQRQRESVPVLRIFGPVWDSRIFYVRKDHKAGEGGRRRIVPVHCVVLFLAAALCPLFTAAVFGQLLVPLRISGKFRAAVSVGILGRIASGSRRRQKS